MSVLVVGLSHHSAPVPTLERVAVSGDALSKLLRDVFQADHIAGTFVVSTCNRVEIYAEVDKFHGGVSAVSELLARHSGIPLPELTPHLYVHYEDRAIQHLLSVACGLESMVVGESQILGQVRHALALAREQGTLGRVLDDFGSLALRAAKRAHAETGIDHAGANLVSIGLELAASRLPPTAGSGSGGGPGTRGGNGESGQDATGGSRTGRPVPDPELLAGRRLLVVGAGSMSALTVATASRLGAAHIAVANRTPAKAERLASSVSGSTATLGDLAQRLADADLTVSCTGAIGLVITAETVAEALRLRRERFPDGRVRPLILLDLALPRDVDPAAAGLPGVDLLDLESLEGAGLAMAAAHAGDVAAVRSIVAEEFAARVSARKAARVAPTVVALRAKAAQVVESELARLAGRLDTLEERERSEIATAMRRVVDKLLHAPTVRVKELAGSPGGDSYEDALRVLFDLDPDTVEAVTRADVGLMSAAANPAPSGPRPRPPRPGQPEPSGLTPPRGETGR